MGASAARAPAVPKCHHREAPRDTLFLPLKCRDVVSCKTYSSEASVQCTLTITYVHGTTTADRTENAPSAQNAPAVSRHRHLCRRSNDFLTFSPRCVLQSSSSRVFRGAPASRWLGHTCSGNASAVAVVSSVLSEAIGTS